METGTQDTSIDSNPSASQDSADETLIATPTRTMEEDSARECAEGRSTKEQEKDTDKKRERKKKQLEACSYTRGLRVKKIWLDLPQQMYVLDIDSPDQNLYLLVRSDTLQLDNFIYKDQRADTYNYIKRSFDTWLDVRNIKNFLYSLERIKEIEKFSKELKLKLL